MTTCTERNLDFIKSLDNITPYKRKKLIKNASEDNILALKEIAHNILKGKLKSVETNKLKRHKKSIRNFVKKKYSLKTKKKLLVQKGGFLPLMI